jgi:molybdopterin molybdotransferase
LINEFLPITKLKNLMHSVNEAKQLVRENTKRLNTITIDLENAHGRTLAEDLYAQINLPPFVQSSMDGYAFAFASYDHSKGMELSGEMAAGANADLKVQPSQAVRIFTGAPLPENTDTVLIQEKAKIVEGVLYSEDAVLQVGNNVRAVGSEIEKGTLGLQAGTYLTPAAIGFIAGQGITKVQVYRKPKVSIIVTGDELQSIGNELAYGQIYESNSHTVKAALHSMGIIGAKVYTVKDSLEEINSVLQEALEKSDLILMTGGVSVGEYDFVAQANEKCGVERLFHKIKQKPGKPIFFGKKENKIVFGLPGNPSSVLTCMYQYVSIAIDSLCASKCEPLKIKAPVKNNYKKPLGITHFLKGYFDGESVEVLDGQESYKLRSFARSNCLVEIEEDKEQIVSGETAVIYIIP